MSGQEENTARCIPTIFNSRLTPVYHELGQYIRREEASFGDSRRAPDTLMGHLERVAARAVYLALQEGVDPLLAELAGLFHDAGKFHGGKYHEDNTPEEEYSIEILREMGQKNGLDPVAIELVAKAIAQLYRDDPQPTSLSMVLFDADNLDKLGLPGISQYFIKSGLRGQGLSAEMIVRLTVELTYARFSTRGLFTRTARAIAEKRSADSIRFIYDFLQSLREDGLFDARVERIQVCDLEVEVITPASCACGASMGLKNRVEKGKKCTEIHLEIACGTCANRYEIRFCRPRLIV